MIPDRRSFLAATAAMISLGPAALASKEKTMFRIGAIADVQYADKADAPPHFYRAVKAKLQAAVGELNRHDLGFVVHMGDFIDGGWENFTPIKAVAAECRHPWHFVLGNHDFNVADDKKLLVPQELGMPGRYYDFACGGWHFVVLDGNDQSTYAWPAGSTKERAAQDLLKNTYPAGKLWNGAIGPQQAQWLENILTATDGSGTPVALLCHFPIYPPGDENIPLWNAAAMVAAIEPHPSVKLWLNGHEHKGGYAEKAGIHYLNLCGMLDTEQNAFAVLDFTPGKIVVHGYGREPSRELTLR
ncbi:MAG: metallophosphoesterase [Rhizomicrobium sp.]